MTNTRLTVSAILALAASAASHAQPAGLLPMDFNIESQPLDQAINAWARQTGYQVLAPEEPGGGVRIAPVVKGRYTPETGLKVLLASTDLQYQFVNRRTVAIRAADPQGAGGATSRNSQAAADQERSGAKYKSPDLEEIVVTAQKRDERLQDVPVPVTAISGQSLVENNQVRLQDYYTSVPGLSMTTLRDSPVLAVRGITTGVGTNPTVAIIVDDVPYGSSTALGGGTLAADYDPSDLARVEVLRGPQGTLYGAQSLGGLLKFVTIDPSTDGFSGRVQGGLSSVRNGDVLGYNARASVNVPLSETWAVRASGFKRRDAGYIDDVRLGKDGLNEVSVDGGRLSALWKPSQDFSLKLGALIQDSQADGASYVNVSPGSGNLQQNSIPHTGTYDRKVQVYSATVRANLGSGELTAVSGYNINELNDRLQFSPGLASPEHNETRKFSQELRYALPLGTRVDWLMGGFYTRESSDYVQSLYSANATTGELVGDYVALLSFPTDYKEYAAFTNFAFHLTDRFDVQVGGRESKNKQTFSQASTGPFFNPPIFIPTVHSDDTSFTYVVTPRFKVSEDLMVYARFASGYRAGGPNTNNPASGVPTTFEPDTTQNYEVGAKGAVANGLFSYDVSVYYIDWKDIQVSLLDPVSRLGYTDNGSRARSQGVELSIETRPLTGLTLAGWVGWNDSQLTEDFPASSSVFGLDGDRLPLSSRFSSNLSLDHSFPLTGNLQAFYGASVSYVGERKDAFTRTALQQRQVLPAYAKTDVRAGVTFDTWSVRLFGNNITDRRGVQVGNPAVANSVVFIQPRTVGLSVAKTF